MNYVQVIISIVDISDGILCIVSNLPSGFAFQKVPKQINPAQVITPDLVAMVLSEGDFPLATGGGHWQDLENTSMVITAKKGSMDSQHAEVSPT